MDAARRTPRLFLSGVAVLLGLLAADIGAWLYVTARMADDLVLWERQSGLHISHAPATRAGWPLAAELALPDFTIAAEPLSWRADQVTLSLAPWRPGTLLVTASPRQSLVRGDAPPISVTADRLALSAPLSGDPASADGHGLRFMLPQGPLTIAQADARFDPNHLALTLQGVTLPLPALPFGGSLDQVVAEGSATVPILPAADLRTALSRWRAAGGGLLLDRAVLHWGPLDAAGTGRLALDAALQPVGNATLHLTGYGELIDALARSGAITRNDARVAATLLGLMAHAPADGAPAGAPPFVDLPLTLQDGTLAMGAIPLARVPRLALP